MWRRWVKLFQICVVCENRQRKVSYALCGLPASKIGCMRIWRVVAWLFTAYVADLACTERCRFKFCMLKYVRAVSGPDRVLFLFFLVFPLIYLQGEYIGSVTRHTRSWWWTLYLLCWEVHYQEGLCNVSSIPYTLIPASQLYCMHVYRFWICLHICCTWDIGLMVFACINRYVGFWACFSSMWILSVGERGQLLAGRM